MEIQFNWATSTTKVHQDEFESNFRDEINDDITIEPLILPCHPEVVTAHILSTDPIEVCIEGKLVCSCGKSYLSFACGSDGSNLTYV
jgi:hypothetical protein